MENKYTCHPADRIPGQRRPSGGAKGTQYFRRQGGFPPKTVSIPEIFPAQPYKGVFCASVGFYDVTAISFATVRRTAQSLMFSFVNSADNFLRSRKMLWNLSIAFLPKKPYTAISKREPPLKVSFFLNLLHLGQHRFQTEAVLSFFAPCMPLLFMQNSDGQHRLRVVQYGR